MAGASIPLTPAVHQMIDVGPVPRFADAKGDIEFPIVRDMDINMYERQDGIGLEIGSYAHRSILHDPEEIPSIEEAQLSPTEFPFTADDFEPQIEHALELMPEIVGDETVGQKYAINGLLSLTPDGMPLLGETPEVKGLWSVAAVWIKEGPGIGKAVAGVDGARRVRDRPAVVRHRALPRPPEDPPAHQGRTAEAFPKTYGIVHPDEQWASDRNVRLLAVLRAPEGARRRVLRGRRLGAAAVVRDATPRSSRSSVTPSMPREASGTRAGGRRSSTPSTSRCARRPASSTSRRSSIFDIQGPGALDTVQQVCMRQMDVPVGRVVYTPVLVAQRWLQVRPHDHAPRPTTTSASSPAARTAWPTSSGSATTCPRTARHSSST